MPDPAILVLTTVPDHAVAKTLAHDLLDRRLAACVNIAAPVQSIYHWQARIETADEVPLVVKTRAALYSDVEAAIRKLHPYDTPEIIAIPVAHGDARYLAWLAAETAQPTSRSA